MLEKIKKAKENIPAFIKINKIPNNFLFFYKYVRSLSFEEKPNYDYLKNLLKDIAIINNIDLDF